LSAAAVLQETYFVMKCCQDSAELAFLTMTFHHHQLVQRCIFGSKSQSVCKLFVSSVHNYVFCGYFCSGLNICYGPVTLTL